MKSAGKVRGLIFDFNGVLLWDDQIQRDSWRAFASQLCQRSLTDDEIDIHIHGRSGRYTLEYLLGEPIEAPKIAVLMEQKEALYRQMCLNLDGDFKLSPGSYELLEDLVKHKIPITIATASIKKNVDFFVEHLRLDRWFDVEQIVFDDGISPGKPAPDPYISAARQLNLAPQACVVIEDSRSGIHAAHAAGVGWLVALGPVAAHHTLARLPGVDQVITNLGQADIQDWFEHLIFQK
jgi:beta-phosphoglucomutase-like phosphatase (HAD superfamily)